MENGLKLSERVGHARVVRSSMRSINRVVGGNPFPEEQMGLRGPDPEDSRDLEKDPAKGVPEPVDLVKKYFPRGRIGIRNQYRTNRCGGFAGANGLLVLHHKLNTLSGTSVARNITYSANYPYYHATPDKSTDGGVYMRDLMKALKKHGAPAHAFWSDSSSFRNPPDGIHTRARFRISGYQRIRYNNSIIENMNRVLGVEELPLWTGMDLYERATDKAVKTGWFPVPADSDKPLGGHAVLVIGWFRERGSVNYTIVNSWGPRPGDSGLFYLPAEYFENGHVRDIWTVPDSGY